MDRLQDQQDRPRVVFVHHNNNDESALPPGKVILNVVRKASTQPNANALQPKKTTNKRNRDDSSQNNDST